MSSPPPPLPPSTPQLSSSHGHQVLPPHLGRMRIALPPSPGSSSKSSPPRHDLALALPGQRHSIAGGSVGMLVRLHGGNSCERLFGRGPMPGIPCRLGVLPGTLQGCSGCGLESSCSSVESSQGGSGSGVPLEPPPTAEEEKERIFKSWLTVVLSCVYGAFLVTLGLVVYISDLLLGDDSPMAETFSIYLVVIGLGWFVFLYSDIRRYLSTRRASHTPGRRRDSLRKSDLEDAAGPVPSYCFSQDRHSGSFYLKIGAAGFCFGHLIHSGLLLGYQVALLGSEDPRMRSCASLSALMLDLLYPTYSFFQLFFIFKYSNVIINRYTALARFALMHCISSSLCFWLWTILRETVDSLSHLHHQHAAHGLGLAVANLTANNISSSHHHEASGAPYWSSAGSQSLAGLLNGSALLTAHCGRGASTLSDNLENFSPYLYPFTIEYSILVVGVLFVMWRKIGLCHVSLPSEAPLLCRQLPSNYEAGFSSNVVLHADCHAANKGLFAGLMVLVGSAVSIIFFFVAMADRAFVATGLTVNAATELTLLVLMTLAVAAAYRQLARLDVRHLEAEWLLDDVLLFACIPAFFLYAIFSIMPAVRSRSFLSISTTVLQVVQVLLQTPFIMDGLRRCSNTRALRFQKPGRELVTFLVVCNVAMWVVETFEIKSQDARDDRFAFYGSVLWTMLSHMTLPLTMFYRFHSSVCLVDIWKSAYEPAHRPQLHP